VSDDGGNWLRDNRRRQVVAALGAVSLAQVRPTQRVFPERAITLICPWTPGGNTDAALRFGRCDGSHSRQQAHHHREHAGRRRRARRPATYSELARHAPEKKKEIVERLGLAGKF